MRWRSRRSRPHHGSVWCHLRPIVLAALVLAAILPLASVAGLRGLVAAADRPLPDFATATLVLDRDGRLLRAFPIRDGRWRLAADIEDVDPRFIELLLAYEDRRFHAHRGLDLRAAFRAAWQFARNGRIVSGASTLSMQTARLIDDLPTRAAGAKARQALRALALERRVGKAEILRLYLNLAPYGGNIEGVRAASLAWFGHEPKRLSAAEAALLVALPQSPEARRPDRDPKAARAARDRVIERGRAAGLLDEREAAEALATDVPRERLAFPMLAAHVAERAHRAAPGKPEHHFTIDSRLQARLEKLAAERAAALSEKVSVAILVADHRSGEILASVGSSGLSDAERNGYLDMTEALRSPGSTLKPLIYGLAFERGVAHPESLIEDRPTAFGSYAPRNFDHTFHGTVTVRRALQLSLNLPAVQLLSDVGPSRLVARLRRAGGKPAIGGHSPPGLAIGLGGVGVTLTDLVRLYAAIANGGRAVPLVLDSAQAAAGSDAVVLERRAAWQVTSILAGAPGPSRVSPGDIAFKTGTSYGYRDAWAIGYDGAHVVGVWAGRPDGAPVRRLVGIDAAAPILLDAFARIGPRVQLPAAPPGIVVAGTSALPEPLRRVGAAKAASGRSPAPEIAFPPNGARIDLGLAQGAASPLALKVRHGAPPFTWFANGEPVARAPFATDARWAPDGPGFVDLAVVDAAGQSARVSVFIE